MSEVPIDRLIPQRKTRTGGVVFYRVTLIWISIMVTIIALLLMKEFGWIG